MDNDTSTIVIAGFNGKKAVELNRFLGLHYAIHTIDSESDVLPILDAEKVDLIICQYGQKGFDALKILREARVSHPETVRLIAGSLDRVELKKAINEAAIYQFVPNEFSVEQIELLVRRTLENREFDASALCSRKLWQLINSSDAKNVAECELEKAVSELTARKHYLAELARIGKLGGDSHNA